MKKLLVLLLLSGCSTAFTVEDFEQGDKKLWAEFEQERVAASHESADNNGSPLGARLLADGI